MAYADREIRSSQLHRVAAGIDEAFFFTDIDRHSFHRTSERIGTSDADAVGSGDGSFPFNFERIGFKVFVLAGVES